MAFHRVSLGYDTIRTGSKEPATRKKRLPTPRIEGGGATSQSSILLDFIPILVLSRTYFALFAECILFRQSCIGSLRVLPQK